MAPIVGKMIIASVIFGGVAICRYFQNTLQEDAEIASSTNHKSSPTSEQDNHKMQTVGISRAERATQTKQEIVTSAISSTQPRLALGFVTEHGTPPKCMCGKPSRINNERALQAVRDLLKDHGFVTEPYSCEAGGIHLRTVFFSTAAEAEKEKRRIYDEYGHVLVVSDDRKRRAPDEDGKWRTKRFYLRPKTYATEEEALREAEQIRESHPKSVRLRPIKDEGGYRLILDTRNKEKVH